MDDTLHCPQCGADVYSTETICWQCQAPLPRPAAPAEAPAALGLFGNGAAQAGGPPARAEDAASEARRLARWSFGFGVASVVLACPWVGPAALWLGARARRDGADALAGVGMTLGILGTIVTVGAVMVLLTWGADWILDLAGK